MSTLSYVSEQDPPGMRVARFALSVFLGVVVSIPVSLAIHTQTAAAAPPAPNVSAAYNVSSTDPNTAFTLGCNDGNYDYTHGYTKRLAVLAFGEQWPADGSAGTLNTVNSGSISNAQVVTVSSKYALGYWSCVGAAQVMDLAITTSNYNKTQNGTAAGTQWALNMHNVSVSADGHTASANVTYWGGNDIESWGPPGIAEAWAQAWDSHTAALYTNVGSYDGCPTDGSYASGYGENCVPQTGYTYTQDDYWTLSWGYPNALSVPEIYVTNQPGQFLGICRYGSHIKSNAIYAEGPSSYYYVNSIFLTPSQSWVDFYNGLAGTECAQTPTYLVAFKNE